MGERDALMAWVRLDDGFTGNAKISQLSDAEFRVWMRLLCHCGRTQDPSVDKVAMNEVAGLTPARVKVFFDLGLLDRVGREWEVHHWPDYQPKDVTNAERQAKWRARKRNVPRNAEVTVEVTENVTPGDPDSVTKSVTPTVTSLARTRVPVPVPHDVDGAKAPPTRRPDPMWNALCREVGEPTNDVERGVRNAALKALRQSGATPSDITLRCQRYRQAWPDVELTAPALAKHWSAFAAANGKLTAPELLAQLNARES